MADDTKKTIPSTPPAPATGVSTSAAQVAADDLAQLTAKPIAEENLADVVEEFEAKQKDFQAMYNAGGHFKEQVEVVSKNFKEKAVDHMETIPTKVELEKKPELDGYVEATINPDDLVGGVRDDYTQSVLLGNQNPTATVPTMPLTQAQIQQGLQANVWQGIRWLAEWCVRQMKILGGVVKFKE